MERVLEAIESVIKVKRDTLEKALATFLSGGHLLIEDLPGTGKTSLALALARALGLSFKRVQFTSDLMPSDLTGVNVFNPKTREFEFKEGPVFTNVLLADEINRATPKTQSALLEAMSERQVSVDGKTYPLPEPFFVVATQNPLEQHGTYPLPEAQLDRFSTRISLGYPSVEEEAQIISGENPLERVKKLEPVVSKEELLNELGRVRRVFVSPELARFTAELGARLRRHPAVVLGPSTRALIHLTANARALAYLRGRDFVVPEDLLDFLDETLGHRLVLREEAGFNEVKREVLEELPVP
ncbi:MAG: AAA domain-containing protein [Aquificae bacterium]|nr:AAA domain-containing protein [Aquificota bacterium]